MKLADGVTVQLANAEPGRLFLSTLGGEEKGLCVPFSNFLKWARKNDAKGV